MGVLATAIRRSDWLSSRKPSCATLVMSSASSFTPQVGPSRMAQNISGKKRSRNPRMPTRKRVAGLTIRLTFITPWASCRSINYAKITAGRRVPLSPFDVAEQDGHGRAQLFQLLIGLLTRLQQFL